MQIRISYTLKFATSVLTSVLTLTQKRATGDGAELKTKRVCICAAVMSRIMQFKGHWWEVNNLVDNIIIIVSVVKIM